MRTMVDLPPDVLRRVQEIADCRGQSVSTTVADLAARGLALYDKPLDIRVDEQTGFPVVSIAGRLITPEEVAELLEED